MPHPPNGSGGAAGAPASNGEGGVNDAGTSSIGSAGEPPVTPGNRTIGSRCDRPTDCKVGLTCITETTTALNGGAPPHGLCTATCTGDAECGALTAGAVCYPFDPNGGEGYCVEGCTFGQQGLFRKCHARLDFSCMPALVQDTGAPCASGCLNDEICLSGTCQTALAACIPTCRGDVDCAAGLYCDQSFLGGTCLAKKPVGKRLGEPCTVPSALDPLEPDECLGYCAADLAGGSAGHCFATCGLGNSCAWDAASKRFDGACYYQSPITSASVAGDFGFCAPTCNCTAECGDPSLGCYAVTGIGALDPAVYRGPGLCFTAEVVPNEPTVEQCQ